MKHLFISIVFLFLLTSCKSLKSATKLPITDTEKTTVKSKVAMAHEKAAFSNKSLEAKINAIYEDGNNSQNLIIKLKIEKDKVIWMSGTYLGFPVAKIMITPDKIQYFEKINKTYFEGDFSLFQKVFGVEMNFQQIQNLLLGQAFFDFKDGVSETLNESNQFILTPLVQNPKFDIFYVINPINFKLVNQEAKMPKNESFKVNYPEYQSVSGQSIPAKINIESMKNTKNTKIFLDIRQVELNGELTFPFEIPNGYEKLNLDQLNK